VLEFIHGKDMEAIINDTKNFLPEEQVLTWAIELCDVLDYLHKHKPDPIIFRDMKPSNVMINNNGDVMLVDFGIAKTFQTGIKGTMIGTEGYSPPEQYRGEATPAADIYALGATIHHALTRRDPRLEPPFSFAERPLRRINPAVSHEMEAVVNMALEYNPESRFRTAADMKQALHVARKTGALVRRRCQAHQTGPSMRRDQAHSGRSNARMRSAARLPSSRAHSMSVPTITTCMR
jgi:eukaryotic-like serine/threonine-protein kinase